MSSSRQLTIAPLEASPQEAAAVIAAVQQFIYDTTPVVIAASEPETSRWKRAALLEGVSRQPQDPVPWL